MPRSARSSLWIFTALIAAMVLATPAASQVMVASSLFTPSSGSPQQTHPSQRQHFKYVKGKKKQKPTAAQKQKETTIKSARGIVNNLKPLFSWEDIQEFQKKHWEEWNVLHRF
jgi:hypothetical protein